MSRLLFEYHLFSNRIKHRLRRLIYSIGLLFADPSLLSAASGFFTFLSGMFSVLFDFHPIAFLVVVHGGSTILVTVEEDWLFPAVHLANALLFWVLAIEFVNLSMLRVALPVALSQFMVHLWIFYRWLVQFRLSENGD